MMKPLAWIWILCAIAVMTGTPPAMASVDTPSERIVFYVAWYDVGKAALSGRPGIIKVTSGWHRFREVNTVDYNPDLITPEEMIDVLKEAGTYAGVAD